MPDMRDVITKAIQSYAPNADGSPNMVVLAMAPLLAEHLVDTLPLNQEWAVGATVDGKLDDIDDETWDREEALRSLASAKELDRQWAVRHNVALSGRQLYTRFSIDWIPEEEPDIEEDLLRLVEQDEDDGIPEPEHDWQPTGFSPA
jgi:hypothetical protein